VASSHADRCAEPSVHAVFGRKCFFLPTLSRSVCVSVSFSRSVSYGKFALDFLGFQMPEPLISIADIEVFRIEGFSPPVHHVFMHFVPWVSHGF